MSSRNSGRSTAPVTETDGCLRCDERVPRTRLGFDGRCCGVVCSSCSRYIQSLSNEFIEASRYAPRLPGDKSVNLWELATHMKDAFKRVELFD
jgi:hypothetical protein